MKIETKECTDTNIRVVVHGEVSFANAIRRILLGEVPTAAIDVVEIKENRTVLADEMLANRLGLVPIRITRSLVLKTECDCDSYCHRCSVKLVLREHNTGDRVQTVTGKHLRPETPGEVEVHDSLLAKLAPGQHLDVTCIARRGAPLSHAKYCLVTAVGFVYDRRNRTRATRLWFEDDVRREWPGINQDEDVDWGECGAVELDIEVVEGVGHPRDILLSALEIFRSKMAGILEQLE